MFGAISKNSCPSAAKMVTRREGGGVDRQPDNILPQASERDIK